MTRLSIHLALLLAILATIGCDRVTKHVAASHLSDVPGQSFFADTFRLEYTENRGAFLSLGADWPRPVTTAIVATGNALLVALFVAALRRGWPARSLFGGALFVGGAVSNLLDRIVHGAVIDFMNVGIGPVRTGIFNVADMAIMLGLGIVLIDAALSPTPS